MRTRNNVILFRLDDKEHAYLKKQVKLSGLSMASYLRAIIKGYEVRPAPTEETIKLLHLLFGMSNNLNQLTMLAHIHGYVTTSDMKKIEEFRSELWDVIDAVKYGEPMAANIIHTEQSSRELNFKGSSE